MNESNNDMHNILENYSSHNDIKIHSRMHPKFKTFSNPLAMKLKSVMRTHERNRHTIPPQYLKKYTPMYMYNNKDL